MFEKLKEKIIDKLINFLSTPSFSELGQAVEGLKVAYLKSMVPILRPICKLLGLQIKKEFLDFKHKE